MARVCIICEKEIETGYSVKDSYILHLIKKIKAKLNMLKNNELMVCMNCLETYKKRRKGFEQKILLNLVISILLLFFILLVPLIFNSSFNITSLILLVLVLAILVFLSFLSYIPNIEQKALDQKEESKNTNPTDNNLAVVPLEKSNLPQPLELVEKSKEIQQSISSSISLEQEKLKEKTMSKKPKKEKQKKKVKKKTSKSKLVKKESKSKSKKPNKKSKNKTSKKIKVR